MKRFFVALGLLWSVQVAAKPPAPSAAQELSKEARALYDQADKEADPTKADEMRKEACEKWKGAFEASRDADYQLALGLCHATRKDYPAAIAAYRVFLMLAPLTHKDRPIAEQSIEHFRDLLAAAQPPIDFVVNDPIPFIFKGSLPPLELKKEKHPWRKPLAITGGALGGAGVIAAFVVRGLVQAQSPESPQIALTELER